MERVLGTLQSLPGFFGFSRHSTTTGACPQNPPATPSIAYSLCCGSAFSFKQKEEALLAQQVGSSPADQKVQRVASLPLQLKEPNRKRLQLQKSPFSRVVRYLPNWQLLVQDYSRSVAIDQLCHNIQEANWNAILSCYAQEADIDTLATDALIAFYQQRLSYRQFSTLTFCWAIFKEFPDSQIHIQPLFTTDGKIEQRALEAIKQGLCLQNGPYERKMIGPFEVDKLCTQFFKKIHSYERSEHYFFYIDFPEYIYNQGPDGMHVRDWLAQRVGLGVFDLFSEEEQHFQMVPSFSMIQALVDSYSEENRIAVCPTIALSTLEDLSDNARERGRDLCLPFPKVAFPTVADGIEAPDFFQFLRHDIYHCLTVGQIPDYCRKETARVFTCLTLLQEQFKNDVDPMMQSFLKVLMGHIIDLDFPSFRPFSRLQRMRFCQDKDFTDAELFLMELQSMIFLAGSSTLKEITDEPLLDEKNGEKETRHAEYSRHFAAFCSRTPLFKEWAKWMYQDGFFERFKLDMSATRLIYLTKWIGPFVKGRDFAFDNNVNFIAHLYQSYFDHQKAMLHC